MPTQVASIGPALTLVQNQTYALPAKLCFLTALAAVETSVNGSTWVPLANATSGALTSSVFLRSTTANNIVVLKEASEASLGMFTVERLALVTIANSAAAEIDAYVAIPNPTAAEIRAFLDRLAIITRTMLVRLAQL